MKLDKKGNIDFTKKYSVITQEDTNGDLLLPIPPILLEQLGWKEGDDSSCACLRMSFRGSM